MERQGDKETKISNLETDPCLLQFRLSPCPLFSLSLHSPFPIRGLFLLEQTAGLESG